MGKTEFIANAVYHSDSFGKTRLLIYAGEKPEAYNQDRDSSIETLCFHYENELAQTIMKLAATRELPAWFNFRGDKCRLISYSINNEERFYNKYRKNYTSEKAYLARHDEIVVYVGHCKCPKCYSKYGFDSIENICGIVSTEANPKAKVSIDLQRCKHCLTFFIDRQSLIAYEKQFGKLMIHRCSMEEFMRRPSPWVEDDFAPDSILSRNGYYAKYPADIRRQALICMMENGIKKAEIKNKLTEFIELRGERCYMAVDIWRSDLKFVNDYNLSAETKVEFAD